LPYEFNPGRGFVSSANNKSVSNTYPYYITEWYDVPYRIRRIRQMLSGKDKLSTGDFKRMLNDHHSAQADDIKPVLLQHLGRESGWNDSEKKAVSLLKKWDNEYRINDAAPMIFDTFLIELVKQLVQDEMPENLFEKYLNSILLSKYLLYNVFKKDDSAFSDNLHTPEKENFHQIIILAFRKTVKLIEKEYGSVEKAEWGDAHRLSLEHPLGKVKLLETAFQLNREFKAPGNNNTVNPFSYDFDRPFVSRFGASQKHIFNTADWNRSYSILPTGTSGIPASEFYCNQSGTYVSGELLPDIFDISKVKTSAKYKSVFIPEK
jgi:penicillin amidase